MGKAAASCGLTTRLFGDTGIGYLRNQKELLGRNSSVQVLWTYGMRCLKILSYTGQCHSF